MVNRYSAVLYIQGKASINDFAGQCGVNLVWLTKKRKYSTHYCRVDSLEYVGFDSTEREGWCLG